MAEKKPAPKKEKAKSTNGPAKRYEISGDSIKKKNKNCPKCGPGMYLANHKDRWTCGKCGFMEKK